MISCLESECCQRDTASAFDLVAMTDLRRRAAFDIGSGATKLMIADVAKSSVAKDYCCLSHLAGSSMLP